MRDYDAERRAASRARELVEQRLGRKLRPKEYVYHVDRDVYNLSLENLELISPEDPRSIYYEDGREKVEYGAEVFV